MLNMEITVCKSHKYISDKYMFWTTHRRTPSVQTGCQLDGRRVQVTVQLFFSLANSLQLYQRDVHIGRLRGKPSL
jgi:hypothetical protein